MFDITSFEKKNFIIPSEYYNFNFENYLVSLRTGIFIRFNHLTRNHLHMHNDYEICIVISGTGEFIHQKVKYPLKPGCVFIADIHVMHEISSLETKDLYLFFYTFSMTKKNNSKNDSSVLDLFLKKHKICYISSNYTIEYLDLYTKYDKNNYINQTMRKNIIINLFIEHITGLTNHKLELSAIDQNKHPKIHEITSYIQKNIYSSIRVSKMAEDLYMSERNLRRLVKKYHNQTVNELIIHMKLNSSIGYLQNGYPIYEIAQKLGFSSHAYFTKVFKDNFGISPSQFKLTY